MGTGGWGLGVGRPPVPSPHVVTFPPMPLKHLLWVDDEAELLEPHRIFLTDRGYDVELVTNADDALDLVRSRTFDLALLDEQMPGKRGMEVFRELRELAPNLPVVMVTKSEEDATFREAIGANVRDYLVKPVNPRQVLAAVARLLEGPTIRHRARSPRNSGRAFARFSTACIAPTVALGSIRSSTVPTMTGAAVYSRSRSPKRSRRRA